MSEITELEGLSDVWALETEQEQDAIEDLNFIIDEAMKFGGTRERAYLRKLWDGESWNSIKEKLLTEGSCWYVWYRDGIRQYLMNLNK